MGGTDDAWLRWTPADAARVLDPTAVPWWVAGGWAIETFLGHRTRAQEDLDVGIWREDVARLTSSLPGWEFFRAGGGTLVLQAPGAPLAAPPHVLWARPRGGAWSLEVLVEDREGAEWVFRREARVRRTVGALTFAAGDLRVIRPEVQLLYKAKDVRPKDQADFDVVLPRLDAGARDWLAFSLGVVHPWHPWLARLGPGRGAGRPRETLPGATPEGG